LGIIEKHGGTISVHSQLQQGTIFTILLPIRFGHNDLSEFSIVR
jgi:signal transduction histidine kinase